MTPEEIASALHERIVKMDQEIEQFQGQVLRLEALHAEAKSRLSYLLGTRAALGDIYAMLTQDAENVIPFPPGRES